MCESCYISNSIREILSLKNELISESVCESRHAQSSHTHFSTSSIRVNSDSLI
jgi:hypothetical protein